jgi:hypothetical protein
VPTTEEVAMIDKRELPKEAIAHRAYELYVQRGGENGTDVEDWLKAEKELVVAPIFTPARVKSAQAGHTN